MKRFISVLLAITMLVAILAPAVSAADDCVNIYLKGYGHALYSADGEQIYGVDLDLSSLEDTLDEFLVELGMGKLTGDFGPYCDRLYDLIAPAYAKLKLDKNGEATDGSGRDKSPLEKVYVTNESWTGGYYYFDYDWRLSIEYNAELLDQYIDLVLAKTGANKVNLIGRCLGGNIISAYLENAPEESLARIKKVVMYIPSTEGVDFISALFSGKIVLNDKALDNFVEYGLADNDLIGGIEDDTMEALVTIVNFVNEVRVLGFGLDVLQSIVDDIKGDAIARILRDSYASFPSFWAMVNEDDVEDAINFIYSTDELKEEYDGMIKKIRSYHENVQVNARSTMLERIDEGLDIMVISKYNFANLPLSDDALLQSDGTATTTATSFGAVTANFGETLSDEYIASMAEEDLRYLSPDNMIDASTCLLPEKTWFIKNLYHGDFPYGPDYLIDAFLLAEDMTIDTYEEYPQYLDYDEKTDTLWPVEGIDDGDIHDTGIAGKISVFAKFLKFIFDLIKKLFGGELDLF